MAKKSSWNPIAFVPKQVSLISSTIYIALLAVLIWRHTTVPSAPSHSNPIGGINLTEAWLDLSFISNGYHPIDSRRNGAVKDYLLGRIQEILERNEVGFKYLDTNTIGVEQTDPKAVTVFEDNVSNVTFVDGFRKQPWTCYGESENILVYLRGLDDKEGEWWNTTEKYEGQSGVLVNAHYDSVSTGYGSTDDGVGVVTVLQLISYFTTKGNQPKRGVVALLNNGEENGLYGAHNYLMHPLSQFTHTFLNLEGAGAGGRATLFRSTDAEVTRFYSNTPSPFGTVVSGDGFKRGFIKSGTDYSVFHGEHGMRGLDVAFFEPRSRYHTDQDDVKDTTRDSLWHMLSSAIGTMKAMTSYDGREFAGSVGNRGRLDIGTGNDGVWFDVFGRAFAVMKLSTLFALSVVLLVAGPLVLIIFEVLLRRYDKWYPLSRRQYLHSSDDDEPVHFNGLRGLFRFPIAFIVSTAAVIALAYLLAKINPYIVYSSEYAVLAMMLSAWFAVAWFFLAGADRVRPTALQRMYNLIWLYAVSWSILVAATVGENNFQIASGYLVVIYNALVFVALLISYLELLALPAKTTYVEHVSSANDDSNAPRQATQSSRGRSNDESTDDDGAQPTGANVDNEPSESTSLLRGTDARGGNTFAKFLKRQAPDTDGTFNESDDKLLARAYGDEQAWSSSLPQWTWILQFLLLVPINIVVIAQVALVIMTALHQTPADGNAVLPIYLFLAMAAVLLLLPLTPFLHRYIYQIPSLLFLIFIGCLIYNLLAFPFSRDARLKVFFVQTVDLDTGTNNVTLTGLDGYLQDIIGELPSAAGRSVLCKDNVTDYTRPGLKSCIWSGLSPNVMAGLATSSILDSFTNAEGYGTWVDYNITSTNSSAHFSIRGRNTKQCRIVFHEPTSEVHIKDAASNRRYKPVADRGSSQIRLFSRSWDKTFEVNVTWSGEEAKGQTGRIMCMWSDANQLGTIPAFDEVRRFMPVWSAVTKNSDGLVEGWKEFTV